MGNFSKPVSTNILPKLPTFLYNSCKGFKNFNFSSENIFGQLLWTFGDFLLVALDLISWSCTILDLIWLKTGQRPPHHSRGLIQPIRSRQEHEPIKRQPDFGSILPLLSLANLVLGISRHYFQLKVVMGRDSRSEGCGFDSQHRILDGHFSHLFVVRIVMLVWKDKNK